QRRVPGVAPRFRKRRSNRLDQGGQGVERGHERRRDRSPAKARPPGRPRQPEIGRGEPAGPGGRDQARGPPHPPGDAGAGPPAAPARATPRAQPLRGLAPAELVMAHRPSPRPLTSPRTVGPAESHPDRVMHGRPQTRDDARQPIDARDLRVSGRRGCISAPLRDPMAILRSRSYVGLLVFAAILGVPISAVAYGFLALVSKLQEWVFTDLPQALGFSGTPRWWPLPLLALAGVLVALAIRSLPGNGGHSPADGFKAAGAPPPGELPGIAAAALITLSLGVVLGPEAPLIALGAGLGGLAMRLARRDAPAQATGVVAAAGSFAAISTLLGSPLLGAFLLMETSGLGGPALGLVLVPGLVAAGIGSLIFIGLDDWTGLGTFSLALPDLPSFGHPNIAQFGWALVLRLG